MTQCTLFGLGYTGLAIGKACLRSGFAVGGTNQCPAFIPLPPIEGVQRYGFDGSGLSEPLREHLTASAVVVVTIPPQQTDNAWHDVVLETCTPVLERSARAGVLNSIIYLSTLGVYGNHDGAWIDEQTPCRPSLPRTRARLMVERAWQTFGKQWQIPVAILRLGGIYGPGRGPLEKLRSGKARVIIKEGQVFNRIHVADIVQATLAAANKRANGVFNVCDDEPAPPQQVLAHASNLSGLALPEPEIYDKATLPPMQRSFYADNRRASNRKLREELNVELHYPNYREGLKAV